MKHLEDCFLDHIAIATADIEKSVNAETLDLAIKNRWINEKEYKFYMDIIRKRNLSDKQLAWKKAINQKIGNKVNKK